jgi:hypothetical protein
VWLTLQLVLASPLLLWSDLIRSGLARSGRISSALPACCTVQGGNTALMMAASVACPKMVKFLLSKGADIWRQNQVLAPCPLHSSV